MSILFKYFVNVKNCESFRGFNYIYIYIYINNTVISEIKFCTSFSNFTYKK